MAIDKAAIDRFVDRIAAMSVWELYQLTKALEPTFGVAGSPAPQAGPSTQVTVAEKAVEQTEFTVTLTSFGVNKVAVIKAVREATGLGLKESKELVEQAPIAIKEGLPKADADALKQALEDAGSTVSLT